MDRSARRCGIFHIGGSDYAKTETQLAMQIRSEVFDARVIECVVGVVGKHANRFVTVLVAGEVRRHSRSTVRDNAIQRRGIHEGSIWHIHGELAARLALVHAAQHDARTSPLCTAHAIAQHENDFTHFGACALQGFHAELSGGANGLPVGLRRFHLEQIITRLCRGFYAPQGRHRRAGWQFLP